MITDSRIMWNQSSPSISCNPAKSCNDPLEGAFAQMFNYTNRCATKGEYIWHLNSMKNDFQIIQRIQNAILPMTFSNDVEAFLNYYRRRVTFGKHFVQCSNAYFDFVKYETFCNNGFMVPMFICVLGFAFKASHMTPILNYFYIYKKPSVDGDIPFYCVNGAGLAIELEKKDTVLNLSCPPTKQGYKNGSNFNIDWFKELVPIYTSILTRPDPILYFLNEQDYSSCPGYDDGMFHTDVHFGSADIDPDELSTMIPNSPLSQFGKVKRC